MNEILKRFLMKWSCSHKWETVEERKVKDAYPLYSHTYIHRMLICKECGKIKHTKT